MPQSLRLAVAVVGLLGLAGAAANDVNDVDEEIEFLIAAVGASECAFVRNDRRHTASEAEAHLRMKYRRARRHAKTADMFIERLASRSSMSRKVYRMECPGQDSVPSGDWLRARLVEYRADPERR